MINRIYGKAVAGLIAVLITAAVGFAAAADQPAAVTDDTWAKIARYETGQSRTDLSTVEEAIRGTPVEKYAQYEEKLLALIKAPGATYEAKDFACRMLRIVGSAKCLPVIEELIQDEKLSSMARYTVEGMACPEVDKMLRKMLPRVKGRNKAGVISSIAARADKDAVSDLKALVTDSDIDVARASIAALGVIGTPDALKILSKAQVADGLKDVRKEAYLRCADVLLAKGSAKKAAEVYREMMAEGNSKGIRSAAIIGMAKAEKEDAIPALIALLKGSDPVCQRIAGKALMEIKGDKTAAAVLAEMGSLSGDSQDIVLNVLMACESRTAVLYVARMKMTGENAKAVKVAVKALGQLGNASDFDLLAGLVKGGGDLGPVAVESLSRLQGKGVPELIVKLLPGVEPAVRVKLIENLGERQNAAVLPDLKKYSEDADESIRAAAIKSMGKLASEKEIPVLVGMMLNARTPAIQSAGEQAVQSACLRARSRDKSVEPLAKAIKDANAEGRVMLVRCLGRVGGSKALDVIRKTLKDADENVREAAVRMLADWDDDSAIPDILDQAKNNPKENLKIISFRGYVRLVQKNAKKKPAETAKTLAESMSVAMRPDEKKLVLGALSGIGDAVAMDAAQKYIQDEALATEAEFACIRIASRLKDKAREETMAVIRKIAETSKSEANRKKAAEVSKK